jgi:hypothetical protein
MLAEVVNIIAAVECRWGEFDAPAAEAAHAQRAKIASLIYCPHPTRNSLNALQHPRNLHGGPLAVAFGRRDTSFVELRRDGPQARCAGRCTALTVGPSPPTWHRRAAGLRERFIDSRRTLGGVRAGIDSIGRSYKALKQIAKATEDSYPLDAGGDDEAEEPSKH